MNFMELLTEDRRLVILRALAEDPGYSHNESVLQSILAAFGHSVSRDVVKSLISWLAEQGPGACGDGGQLYGCQTDPRAGLMLPAVPP